MTKPPFLALAAVLLLPASAPRAQQSASDGSSPPAAITLRPTNHPRLPHDLAQLWMAPNPNDPRSPVLDELARAVKLEVGTDFAKALPILSQPSVQQGPLGAYGLFYKGLAELRLGRPAEARGTFQALQAREPVGYLAEAAALREAECDEALGDQAAALAVYERLAAMKTTAPDDVLLRAGRAAKAIGDTEKARTAFARVYYEFPFSDLSLIAATELDGGQTILAGSNRYKLELGRAERLFGGKKYAQARTAFEALRGAAQGDDRELVNLRLAECDYFLKRPRNSRDGVRPYVDRASRRGEALFFYAVSLRELHDYAEYLQIIDRIIAEFPNDSWTEEALNNLGTYYILQDDDDRADGVFRQLYEKFPRGRYAERAAWKIGWRAYRTGQYRETTRVFEQAAGDFPRSDYRPPWLYWSGRAHDALDEKALAQARYMVAVLDYQNSYYGRLAIARLEGRAPERRIVLASREDPSALATVDGGATDVWTLPPNAPTVRVLLGLKLYDQAIDELRYAQRAWGDSSPIQATLAWIYQQQAEAESGAQQLTLARGAINMMKRAYPQFMAAGGESLPRELQEVIFPIAYWDLIKKYSGEHHLDPYLVAALTAQESTFVADVRSPAKAVGLMQLVAVTARQYARTLNMKYSPRLLTDPDVNIRIGTAYLADKVREFGELHLVLASYNAGERPVRRWVAERPGLPREEFVDDIPFPETQNYVKKVLGTAEDYRRLYGSESPRLPTPPVAAAAGKSAAVKSTPGAASKKKAPAKPTRKRRKST